MILQLPAFPIRTFLIDTCLQTTDGDPTVSVSVPCALPYSPSEGRAPVPSLVPMAVCAQAPAPSFHNNTGSLPYEPQARHTALKVIRCWQTDTTAFAVQQANGIFRFDIPGEFFSATWRCSFQAHAHIGALLSVPLGTNYHSKYCSIAMQQLENPYKLAHVWPPPPSIWWRLEARHPGFFEPFLRLILEFKLP